MYSWKLEPTDKLPAGKRPCLSLRELKKIGYDLEHRMDPTQKRMSVMELVEKYLSTKTGMRPNTMTNYNFVKNLLEKEDFSGWKIGDVKTSDAKLFLIKLQNDGKGHSTIKTVRGVLRPAFQMAVDDDALNKNPFGFALAGVVVNDSVTREAITKKQMNKFLMPNITPHVCRHTYCSLQAKAGMYPKTLQYLMGHSDISVTMNTYTHLGLEDAVEEMSRMQDVENARKEQEKLNGKTDEVKISKNQFRAG